MIHEPRPAPAVPLSVPAGPARALVLVTVFVCAACGLVYELELIALASYLVGESVTHTSVILSVMVFAMGVGSLLAKRLHHVAAVGFAAVEAALALIGGLSVTALYASFAWLDMTVPVMIAFSFTIGMLIGAEIPLLMTLIQQVRRQDASGAVADLFAADYVGALVGGLAFPFLLLPALGQLVGALAVGAVNAVAGGAMILWLFRGGLTPRARSWLLTANIAVLTVLAAAVTLAAPFEEAARRAVHGEPARRTNSPLVNEALVHPAMSGPRDRVLLLGGEEGLAQEVLRYGGTETLTIVNPHPARQDPRLCVEASDPFEWLRRSAEPAAYDVVLADLPGPNTLPGGKLHSQEFYDLVARALAPGGRLAVRAGASDSHYWTIEATIRSAGLFTTPYRAGGGGFILASDAPPALRLPPDVPPLKALTTLHPAKNRPSDVPPSTLLHPRYGG